MSNTGMSAAKPGRTEALGSPRWAPNVAGLSDVLPLPRPLTAMGLPPVGKVRSPPTESCIEGHGGTGGTRGYWRYRRYVGTGGMEVILEVRGDTRGTKVPEVPEVRGDIERYARPHVLK